MGLGRLLADAFGSEEGYRRRNAQDEENKRQKMEKRTGVCSECGGTGSIYMYGEPYTDDNGETIDGSWYETCPRCGGTGKK